MRSSDISSLVVLVELMTNLPISWKLMVTKLKSNSQITTRDLR